MACRNRFRPRLFPLTPLALAAALALPGAGLAQDSSAPQRIEITGSSIKRVQNEGATPLQVVTRAQIDRLAVTSLGDLLNLLPSMAGAEDGGFTLQPTRAGFQGAAMPGFGNADTLVLLNGKRLAKYPVDGDTADLNGIPLSLIDRVEVLRDGASAIYGSDAIAGVVNLITRRDYAGIGVQASFGETSRSDGRKQRGAVWAGFGDLQKNRWNVLFGLEADKVDPIFDRDREITANADLRPYGLPDDRLPTSPEPNVLLLASNRWQPIFPCKPPLPPQGVSVVAAQPGLVCGFNANATTQLQPEVKSTSLFAGATFMLGETMQLRLEHFGKKKESGNFLNPQPITNTVAASDPANPYGEDVIWAFRSVDPRLFRRKNIEVESQRTMAELSGSVAAWDWNVAIGRGQGDYTEISSGYFVNSLFVNAVRTGVVNPFTGRLNPDDLVPLTARPVRTARTVVDFADAKISGTLAKLPAGELAAAFGLSSFDEDYRNTPDPLQAAGLLRGDPRLALVNSGRKAQALFAEAVVPLFKGTELTGAVRHDRYSDFGNTTNGKLSLRVQPSRAFLLRASAGTGFRAPSLEALSATDITGFPNATDFAGCAAAGTPRDQCAPKQIFTVVKSNPALKPEKSEAVTLGLVFEPFAGTSASIDWIKVEKKDAIEALGLQTILDNPDVPVAGFGTARNLVRRLPNGQIDPDTSTPAVIAPTANLAKVIVEVVDLNLRWAFNAGPVRLRLENNSSRLLSRKKEPIPGLPLDEFAGVAGFPKWRNAFSVNAAWGAFEGTAFVRSVAGFEDIDDPSARTAQTRRVPSWTVLDLTFSHHGLINKGTRIDFVVKNATDRMPPLSNALNTADKIDFNHSAIGRYFQIGFKQEF
jgi:iron complex outermembrane receptor protein